MKTDRALSSQALKTLGEGRSQEPNVIGRLVLAVRTVWVYSLSGVLVGWLCILQAMNLEASHAHPALATLLEHVGMGFIVAAVAVLFYEWGAHIKESMKLGEELSAIKSAVGENALDGALRVLIRGERADYDEELIRSIESLAAHIKTLHIDGDWAKYGYARFVSRLLRDVVANAENLQRISVELRGHPAANVAYSIKVKAPWELTDMMLAEQMQRLPKGGKYSTASNPLAWQSDQLKELHSQTREAVTRGVVARRMFVLNKDIGAHGYSFDPDEAERTIKNHFKQAQDWNSSNGGRYEVRIFDTSVQYKVDNAAKNFIRLNHYGVFEFPNADHAVLVQVNRPNLSNLSISGLTQDSEHIVLWNTVWEALPETTTTVIEEIMERWRRDGAKA